MSDGAAVLVVADDLTGANATAAGLAREGLRAVVLGSDQDVEAVGDLAPRYDVVVVSTDSRHSRPDDAAARTEEAVRAGWPAGLVTCRVDTTLRGNVSAAAAAVLRTVAELSGRRTVALFAPAHPAAGRQTVDGTQLLDGRRLEETELARDPRSPATTSSVVEVITAQAELRAATVALSAVTGPADDLRARLREALDDGADVVAVDALTPEHLARAAEAAVAVGPDVVWVAVDPGPGTVALAGALGLLEGGAGAPLLVVSGSATELTRTQLGRLRGEGHVRTVHPVRDDGDAVPEVDGTSRALGEALADADADEVVLLATVLEADDVVDMDAGQAEHLPVALARAVHGALQEHRVGGLLSTGGDVTAALLTELGAQGLEVHDEVVPLAVAGTLVGGPWAGLPVVTKGGLVGDADTASACLQHLRGEADAARRQVRPAAAGGS